MRLQLRVGLPPADSEPLTSTEINIPPTLQFDGPFGCLPSIFIFIEQ